MTFEAYQTGTRVPLMQRPMGLDFSTPCAVSAPAAP